MFVLEKLWREGLSPSERYVRKGSEYKRLMVQLCDTGEALLKMLPEDGKALLEQYDEVQRSAIMLSEEETFITAFRMGAQMMLDVIGHYQGSFYSPGED